MKPVPLQKGLEVCTLNPPLYTHTDKNTHACTFSVQLYSSYYRFYNSSSCMSLPKIVKHTHICRRLHLLHFSVHSPMRAQGEAGLNVEFVNCRQGFHSNSYCGIKAIVIFSFKNLIAGFQKDASTTFSFFFFFLLDVLYI